MLFLSKYNINADTLIADKAIGLVRIVLHTLAAHVHTCDRFSRFNGGGTFPPGYGGLMGGVPARSRDLSQLSSASIGGETEKGDEDDDEEDDEDDEGAAATTVSGGAAVSADVQGDDCGRKEKGGPRKTEPPPTSPPGEGTRTLTTEAQVEPERDSGDVRIPMAGLFGFLPKPAAATDAELSEVDAPTPDHYQLTSEGLPAGWAMQLMRNGRTLFIDNSNQVSRRNSHGIHDNSIDELTHLCNVAFVLSQQITTWIDPRTGKPAPNKDGGRSAGSFVFPTFESPPSPLSLMDVITVGSPVAVDRSGTDALVVCRPFINELNQRWRI